MAFSSASLVRAFSTSGLRRAIVKTPIPVYGIEGRCARLLFFTFH